MNVQQIRDWVEAACPDWAITSIEALGEGDFASAFLVDGQWVVRAAKHAEAAEALSREACLLPKVAGRLQLAVPAPEILGMSGGPTLARHRFLPGPALTRSCYERLSSSTRAGCAEQIGAFLRQLHATPTSIGLECGVEEGDGQLEYEELHADAREHLRALISPQDWTYIESIFRHWHEVSETAGAPVLLHGDLSPDHVLYGEAEQVVTGVIDFGDAAIGDRAWDFVYLYEDYGLEFLGQTLAAYAPTDAKAMLSRMHAMYQLDTVEWAVRCAQERTSELDDALSQVARLRTAAADELAELGALPMR